MKRERERERGSGKQIAWQHKKNRIFFFLNECQVFFITNTNSKKFSYIMRICWMNYCGPVPSRERERVRERGRGGGDEEKKRQKKRSMTTGSVYKRYLPKRYHLAQTVIR